jgi:hypothetical protein
MHVYAMSRNLEEIYGKLACRLNFIAREAFFFRKDGKALPRFVLDGKKRAQLAHDIYMLYLYRAEIVDALLPHACY